MIGTIVRRSSPRCVSGITGFCSLHTQVSRCKQAETVLNVFDRKAKLLQRERAANAEDVDNFDFIKEEIGYRLADRVLDVKREMAVALDIGSGRGYVTRHLTSHSVKKLYATEMSASMLSQCQMPSGDQGIDCEKICLDEDGCKLPFDDKSISLVTSSLSMHWVNDLPGLFAEVFRVLQQDGVFLGAMFGGETLFELRCSLQMAELERHGGIGQHVSPFVDVQDLGGLLNRSGFRMITLDNDEIKVAYPSIFELMRDLKGMGENNSAWKRQLNLRRDTLLATSAIYKELYRNEDDTLPATFQVFYWIGWKPSPTQPKPLKPQKSDVSLKDMDRLEEIVKKKKQTTKADQKNANS